MGKGLVLFRKMTRRDGKEDPREGGRERERGIFKHSNPHLSKLSNHLYSTTVRLQKLIDDRISVLGREEGVLDIIVYSNYYNLPTLVEDKHPYLSIIMNGHLR